MPVDPRVADSRRRSRRGTAGSRAVLFYGSCLRQAELDGLMLDFYLIVGDYRAAYPKRWMAAANALIPPNVFHAEHDGLVAKYAVLSEADFHRLAGPRRATSRCGRASPSRRGWCGRRTRRRATRRSRRSRSRRRPCSPRPGRARARTSLDLWRRAFALTYSAELRAERKARSGSVVDVDPERYRRFGEPALAAAQSASRTACRPGWLARRVEGKMLSVARLAKASLTFAGGADYIVWKINRHAGTDFALKPWQRRHPLLGAHQPFAAAL